MPNDVQPRAQAGRRKSAPPISFTLAGQPDFGFGTRRTIAQPVSRVGCRGHRVSVVDLGRHPQMGAGGHRASGLHRKRHRRWVSVKDVPSKATSPRQHISGADRFISAVFQAASFRGGSPWRYSGLRLRVHPWQRLPTQHGADELVSVDMLIMNTDTKNAVRRQNSCIE